MSYSISGKAVIVTGAANGIGLAIGRHFAAHGAKVMFADMDEAGLVDELGEAIAADDTTLAYFSGDLREKLTQANLLSATLDVFDRVDILVNASRQFLPTDPLAADDTSLDQMLSQNLMTAYRLSQVVARRMISQANGDDENDAPRGSIINLSSIAAQRTHPDLLAYSVSTAALDQMTRSMALALAPHHIRVNAVAFGSVMSASLRNALRDSDETREAIVDATPLARIASPGELAGAVRFLASEASHFMTGQIVTLDGGRTLRDVAAPAAH